MFIKNLLFVAALALAMAAPDSAASRLPVGQTAPTFTLKQLDGKPLALSWLKEKVVLLNFWGPT